MKKGKIPSKYKTQMEKAYELLISSELTTQALAKRMFGATDYFTLNKVTSLLSGLRKMGIDFVPKGGAGGVWILPKTRGEYSEAIAWKRDKHLTGFFRLGMMVKSGVQAHKELKNEEAKLLGEIKSFFHEKNQNILHDGANNQIKTRSKTTEART